MKEPKTRYFCERFVKKYYGIDNSAYVPEERLEDKIAIGTLVEVDGTLFMYNGSEWESALSENTIQDCDPFKYTKSKKIGDW